MARIDIPQDFGDLRRAAYPDAGEQIGALVKGIKALLAGEPPPADALAVIEQVDAVKATFPKPEDRTK